MSTGDTTTAPVGKPGAHPDARTMLADMLDRGSFTSWDAPVVEAPADAGYALALAEARRCTGVDEAVLTGEGLIRGRRVAVLVGEFAFLGGTIGVAAAERLTQAVERATRERLPLLAAPVSGGTRMQEGTVAFLQSRTVDRTAEIAAAQGVRSIDLSAAGIVDHIVAEHPDAAEESPAFLVRLGAVLAYELASLLRRDPVERMWARHERFRRTRPALTDLNPTRR